MTNERLAEIKAEYSTLVPNCVVIRELIESVESLMSENAALRNFANPVQSTDKEEAFYRMADELGWKFKDVNPVP